MTEIKIDKKATDYLKEQLGGGSGSGSGSNYLVSIADLAVNCTNDFKNMYINVDNLVSLLEELELDQLNEISINAQSTDNNHHSLISMYYDSCKGQYFFQVGGADAVAVDDPQGIVKAIIDNKSDVEDEGFLVVEFDNTHNISYVVTINDADEVLKYLTVEQVLSIFAKQ